MKLFPLPRNHRLIITTLISLCLILLSWLNYPLHSTPTNPQTELFNQVWQTVNDNFYDPNFNGVNWQTIKDDYERKIRQTQSREAAATVINQMLSELNTSHTHLYIPNQPAYYQVLGIFAPRNRDLRQQLKPFFPNGKLEYTGIGIVTKTIDNQTFIRAILEGSPAAEAGLKVGDRILSVDNRPFQPIESFADQAGTPVKMVIQRSPNPNSQQEITVTPKLLDTTTMYLDAMDASTEIIEQQGKKIGYIHIWSYASDDYQEQLEEELIYGRLKQADTLVVDLRDGWGGAPLTALNIYTAPNLSLTTIFRDGTKYTHYAGWNKPVVMIVNGGSRSAKEILAYGFQQFDIGPVVGTPTPGAVVAGRPFLMSDGSLLYVAVADVYVNGDERLEGKGVTPDILVPFSPEYAQGADPQKERALEVALEAVQE